MYLSARRYSRRKRKKPDVQQSMSVIQIKQYHVHRKIIKVIKQRRRKQIVTVMKQLKVAMLHSTVAIK